MTVFQEIKQQIVNNEVYGNEPKFVIKQNSPRYPEAIVKWLTSNKILKVDKVDKNYNGKFEFIVYYKDLYTGSDFLNIAYEKAMYDRKKFLDKWDKSVDRRVKADMNRQELECPNWSSEKDEYGYASCPFNTKGYMKIEPENSTQIELMVKSLGYENYADFCEQAEGCDTPEQIWEELTTQFNIYKEAEFAKTYQY